MKLPMSGAAEGAVCSKSVSPIVGHRVDIGATPGPAVVPGYRVPVVLHECHLSFPPSDNPHRTSVTQPEGTAKKVNILLVQEAPTPSRGDSHPASFSPRKWLPTEIQYYQEAYTSSPTAIFQTCVCERERYYIRAA